MNKVEAVARAICAAEDYNPDTSYQPLGKPAGPFWLEFVPHARAAIEAMKGPSETMLNETLSPAHVADLWDRMLQAALDE